MYVCVCVCVCVCVSVCAPPPINGVLHDAVAAWGDLDVGQGTGHQLVVVLENQVLRTHFQSGHVRVLQRQL